MITAGSATPAWGSRASRCRTEHRGAVLAPAPAADAGSGPCRAPCMWTWSAPGHVPLALCMHPAEPLPSTWAPSVALAPMHQLKATHQQLFQHLQLPALRREAGLQGPGLTVCKSPASTLATGTAARYGHCMQRGRDPDLPRAKGVPPCCRAGAGSQSHGTTVTRGSAGTSGHRGGRPACSAERG